MKLKMLKEKSYDRLKNGRSEVLQKNRGYAVISLEYKTIIFAVPLRSNLNHKSGFKTILYNKHWNGVDYSKALVITHADLADEAFKPRDKEEYSKIQKNKIKIKLDFNKYVDGYISFIRSNISEVPFIYKYTTLKYFHNELGL